MEETIKYIVIAGNIARSSWDWWVSTKLSLLYFVFISTMIFNRALDMNAKSLGD